MGLTTNPLGLPVISVTAYLTDYKTNFADFHTAYMAGFPAPRPSRTCIGVSNLKSFDTVANSFVF